jgi:hypothetical protein
MITLPTYGCIAHNHKYMLPLEHEESYGLMLRSIYEGRGKKFSREGCLSYFVFCTLYSGFLPLWHNCEKNRNCLPPLVDMWR